MPPTDRDPIHPHDDVRHIDVTKAIEQHQQLDRERRMKVALDHFSMCESVRKKLELPIDALPLIDKMLHDLNQHDHDHRNHSAPAIRGPLRITSEKKIPRTDPLTGDPTPVRAQPQCAAMRVEQIEILSDPTDWMIADIQVGGHTQFSQPILRLPLPGRLFVPGGTCHHFVCETIQAAMDFAMLVHYVGNDPEGAIFEAVAMGHIAR
jgi:hypothetical protein